MTFKKEMVAAILAGHKTVTRRVIRSTTPPVLVGRSYAVQPGRYAHGVARILIEDVSDVRLGFMDNAEARAEGFDDLAAFVAYWRKMYDGDFDPSMRVWRIEFSLMPAGA